MNKFFKLLILLGIFFTTINVGCKKDSSNPADQLPPATTEGKNTFACLINGTPFNVSLSDTSQGIIAQYFTLSYNPDTLYHEFFVEGTSSFGNTYSTIDIRALSADDFAEGQTINLSDESISSQGNFTFKSTLFTSSNSQPVEGEIHLTKIDTANKILSGTFWFNGYDINKSTKYAITDGRFDVKYNN
jgi:uncharacterized protein DUF6252